MARRWILIPAAAVIILAVTHAWWLSALGGWLIDAEAPAKADAIVVLAGDFTGGRLLTAASLARQGIAPKVLVSGPGGLFGAHESDFAIPFAVRGGYPASYFEPVPNDSHSTDQEAGYMIRELRRMGARRVDIVTSTFHTRRAGRIYRSQAPDIEFHMVASEDRFFHAQDWWRNREGRKTFLVEWLKTIANWLHL